MKQHFLTGAGPAGAVLLQQDDAACGFAEEPAQKWSFSLPSAGESNSHRKKGKAQRVAAGSTASSLLASSSSTRAMLGSHAWLPHNAPAPSSLPPQTILIGSPNGLLKAPVPASPPPVAPPATDAAPPSPEQQQQDQEQGPALGPVPCLMVGDVFALCSSSLTGLAASSSSSGSAQPPLRLPPAQADAASQLLLQLATPINGLKTFFLSQDTAEATRQALVLERYTSLQRRRQHHQPPAEDVPGQGVLPPLQRLQRRITASWRRLKRLVQPDSGLLEGDGGSGVTVKRWDLGLSAVSAPLNVPLRLPGALQPAKPPQQSRPDQPSAGRAAAADASPAMPQPNEAAALQPGGNSGGSSGPDSGAAVAAAAPSQPGAAAASSIQQQLSQYAKELRRLEEEAVLEEGKLILLGKRSSLPYNFTSYIARIPLAASFSALLQRPGEYCMHVASALLNMHAQLACHAPGGAAAVGMHDSTRRRTVVGCLSGHKRGSAEWAADVALVQEQQALLRAAAPPPGTAYFLRDAAYLPIFCIPGLAISLKMASGERVRFSPAFVSPSSLVDVVAAARDMAPEVWRHVRRQGRSYWKGFLAGAFAEMAGATSRPLGGGGAALGGGGAAGAAGRGGGANGSEDSDEDGLGDPAEAKSLLEELSGRPRGRPMAPGALPPPSGLWRLANTFALGVVTCGIAAWSKASDALDDLAMRSPWRLKLAQFPQRLVVRADWLGDYGAAIGRYNAAAARKKAEAAAAAAARASSGAGPSKAGVAGAGASAVMPANAAAQAAANPAAAARAGSPSTAAAASAVAGAALGPDQLQLESQQGVAQLLQVLWLLTSCRSAERSLRMQKLLDGLNLGFKLDTEATAKLNAGSIMSGSGEIVLTGLIRLRTQPVPLAAAAQLPQAGAAQEQEGSSAAQLLQWINRSIGSSSSSAAGSGSQSASERSGTIDKAATAKAGSEQQQQQQAKAAAEPGAGSGSVKAASRGASGSSSSMRKLPGSSSAAQELRFEVSLHLNLPRMFGQDLSDDGGVGDLAHSGCSMHGLLLLGDLALDDSAQSGDPKNPMPGLRGPPLGLQDLSSLSACLDDADAAAAAWSAPEATPGASLGLPGRPDSRSGRAAGPK